MSIKLDLWTAPAPIKLNMDNLALHTVSVFHVHVIPDDDEPYTLEEHAVEPIHVLEPFPDTLTLPQCPRIDTYLPCSATDLHTHDHSQQ